MSSLYRVVDPDVDPILDLLRLDPEPENDEDRLDYLRILSMSDQVKLTHCPECGCALEDLDVLAHARDHYPTNIPRALFSREAQLREAALYRAVGLNPPERW